MRPDWTWWSSLVGPEEELPPLDRWVRGFFPVVRLSSGGMTALEQAYRRGWTGHCEVVVPTAMRVQGLAIEDLGGDGAFVPAGNADRFYTNTPTASGLYPGTFVYRPARPGPGLTSGKLWHPVKPDARRLGSWLRRCRRWLKVQSLP